MLRDGSLSSDLDNFTNTLLYNLSIVYTVLFLIVDSYPANTQRHNNVASTSLRRHDVAATSKQRYNDVVC